MKFNHVSKLLIYICIQYFWFISNMYLFIIFFNFLLFVSSDFVFIYLFNFNTFRFELEQKSLTNFLRFSDKKLRHFQKTFSSFFQSKRVFVLLLTFHGVTWGPTKNLGSIGSAILMFEYYTCFGVISCLCLTHSL